MSHIKRSFIASGAVLLSIGAMLLGNRQRSLVDLGGVQPVGQLDWVSRFEGGALLASKGPQIPEVNYFESVEELLKKEYVEPVTDDKKLVDGAIKGMVSSLNDPDCVYMDPKEFRAFTNARMGTYEGIGAEMILTTSTQEKPQPNPSSEDDDETAVDTIGVRIPRLVVAYVVPGGPADRAGVKVGDAVDTVDGKWVLNAEPFRKLQQLQAQVQKGQANVQDLNRMRGALRLKTKASTLPTRARERLTIGTEGAMTVKWMRGQTMFTTRLEKGRCRMPNILGGSSDGALRVRFVPGEAVRLKDAVAHKSEVVLDLRGNVMGDFTSMKQCIAAVAPAGTYGYAEREQGQLETPLEVKEGNSHPPRITILVDSATGNAAEIFALALSSKGRAKLSGTAMSSDRSISEVISLPDGGGYTLVKAKYSVTPMKRPTGPKRTASLPPTAMESPGSRGMQAFLGSSCRRPA